MNIDDYHSDTSRVSKTMLGLYDDSPERYHATYIAKTMPVKEGSEATRLGTICHQILIENRNIDDICVEYPATCFSDTGRIRSVAAKAFELECQPKLAVRPDMMEQIRNTVDAFRRCEIGKLLSIENSDTHREQQVDADLWGLPCKCRPDIFFNMPDRIVVPDLKFGQYEPREFARSARRFKYYLQQAHYTAILKKVYDKPVQWMFLIGEPKPPYRVGQRCYDIRSIEIARDYHETLVKKLARAYASGVFADNFAVEMSLAPWDLSGDTGFGDPDDNVTEDE